MHSNTKLSSIMYYVTRIGVGLGSIGLGYLLILTFIAAIGQLPKSMDLTYEVPIELHLLGNCFLVEEQSDQFIAQHIEVQSAHLEALPNNRRGPQVIGHLIAFIYGSFFVLILLLLSKILKSFRTKVPFEPLNIARLRNIGFLAIGLAFYEFVIGWIVAAFFANKFTIENASIGKGFSLWEINFVALFLGLILIVLSEVFRTGNDLQELEAQTV